MLFAIVLQFLTIDNFVARGINGHQLAVGVRHVQALFLRINRQPGAEAARAFDCGFQRDFIAINHPYRAALFPNTGDIHGVGFLIHRQLTWLQRFHRFATLTAIKHQTPFHVTAFRINGGDSTVDGVAKPQRLGLRVQSGAKRFKIVMDRLGHFQRSRVQAVHHPTFIRFTAL